MAELKSYIPSPVTPVTVLDEEEFVIVPRCVPTRPPAKVLVPVVTMPPRVCELMMLAPD